MPGEEPARSDGGGIGWARAIASGTGALVIALVATVGVANWILTGLTGLSREHRVWLASTLFMIIVAGCAWALRRLQGRGLI